MILLLCFLPLIIIFILMKFILLVEESHKEITYVRKEPTRKRGPYVLDPYSVDGEENEETKPI